MTRFHAMLVPVVLAAFAAPARAQRWGGSPAAAARTAAPATRASVSARGGAWNGTASKWGGSPVQRRASVRTRTAYVGGVTAYIPVAIAVPTASAETYAADTACTTAPAGAVEMPVVTSNREPRQLTTIEVYRLQPRFQKP